MRFTKTALALCLAVFATGATAQTAPTLAQNGLQARIDHLSRTDGANGFELGLLQTLRAVEKTLQTRYDYGLWQDNPMLPVLRLGAALSRNPAPQPSGPDTLSILMEQLLTDLTTARATLDAAQETGIAPFDLTLTDIWFDVNGNAARDPGEDAAQILGPVVIGRQAMAEFERSATDGAPLTIRFDQADHAWLTAYTHMLSGFANLFLAFDPEPILRDLATARAALSGAPEIPNIYDQDALAAEIEALEAEEKEIRKRVDAIAEQMTRLSDEQYSLYQQRTEATDDAESTRLESRRQEVMEEFSNLQPQQREANQARRLINNEIRSARAKLTPADDGDMQRMANSQMASIDAIYIILAALQQQPDPARIRAAHADWLAMIAHNRTFWARLAQETDNDREWIPNTRQTSALGIEIPARVAAGWQKILADAEAVLEGRLLVPHPLLPQGHGIDLSAYVTAPTPLDLTRWVHGIGAYPYAAKGPRITAQSWQSFQRLTQGNAAGFALFLN